MEIPALNVDSIITAINNFMLTKNGKSKECGPCYYNNKLRT
jgi:hypothetical protein